MLASACALQRPLPSHRSDWEEISEESIESKHMDREVGFEREKRQACFLEQKALVSPAKDVGVGFSQ